MLNSNQIIFVDESGDLILPKEDNKSYYTINAIFFEQNDLDHFSGLANEIVSRHAGTGELKSSNIGNNVSRRKEVLSEIAEANFPFYCLIIDKQRIFRDSGLRYKQVSYKYLHRMFFERIKRSFFNIDLISDPYGHSEFMDSFIRYIQTNGNLFEQIQFIPSPDEPLLQISDVIAGSIRRVYLEQDPVEILKILGYPSIPIEEWPPNISKFSEYGEDNSSNKYDVLVRKMSLKAAREFVENNIDHSDTELRSQAEVVRFLLIKFYEDPTQFVHRYEIERYFNSTGISINHRTILSKLRDNNVIICSTEKGVKIPYNSEDIFQWVQRASSQVVPYLKRVNQVRTDLLIGSQNEYDIVNPDYFPELSEFLNRFNRA